MRPLRRPTTIGILALSIAWSMPSVGSAPDADENASIIFVRQQAMSDLSDNSDKLGEIVAGTAPASELATTTRAIADGAKDALESFRPKVPGGHEKPEVWSNNADFQQRMEAFARNAEIMAKAGETGNVAAVTERMIDAMPCKQCHDLYREPKKP